MAINLSSWLCCRVSPRLLYNLREFLLKDFILSVNSIVSIKIIYKKFPQFLWFIFSQIVNYRYTHSINHVLEFDFFYLSIKIGYLWISSPFIFIYKFPFVYFIFYLSFWNIFLLICNNWNYWTFLLYNFKPFFF